MRMTRMWVLCGVLAWGLMGCGGDAEMAEEVASEPVAAAAGGAPAAAPARDVRFEVPAGTGITVELGTTLSAANNDAGQSFAGTISEDVIVDGRTVIPAGTSAEGRILEATESGRVQGVAEIALEITSISIGGNTIPVSTRTFEARAETSRTEDAATIGAGAGIGAAVGGILGGGDGAALGAAIGGGGGTAVVLATRGDDIELPAGTRVNFVLAEAVELP